MSDPCREVVLFRIDRKTGLLILGVSTIVLGGFALAEQLTLTTSYPVPSGIYNQLITTGNGSLATTFNRNGGNTILVPNDNNPGGRVGIGTTSPGSKLDVVGTVAGTNLQVNGVVVADTVCTSNGLVARDATGLLLSCQSGLWKTATGGGGINYADCVTLYHSEAASGASGCAGWVPSTNPYPFTSTGICPNDYVAVGMSTGARYPSTCQKAMLKCCRLR